MSSSRRCSVCNKHWADKIHFRSPKLGGHRFAGALTSLEIKKQKEFERRKQLELERSIREQRSFQEMQIRKKLQRDADLRRAASDKQFREYVNGNISARYIAIDYGAIEERLIIDENGIPQKPAPKKKVSHKVDDLKDVPKRRIRLE